jgi:hypothetical protein
VYSSSVNLGAADPQTVQNLSVFFSGAPHLTQYGKQSPNQKCRQQNKMFSTEQTRSRKEKREMSFYAEVLFTFSLPGLSFLLF